MMFRNPKTYLLPLFLFLVTFATTTLAGHFWIFSEITFEIEKLTRALPYPISFLLILTVHEFGHYFVGRLHGVKSSLPYFIPMFLGNLSPTLGTMGAFIKMQSKTKTNLQIFDIGIAGPLAGFVIALAVLGYGVSQLGNSKEYLYTLHPEYKNLGPDLDNEAYTFAFLHKQDSLAIEAYKRSHPEMAEDLRFPVNEQYLVLKTGENLLFNFIKQQLSAQYWFPNPFELYHFPYLFAAYLALFFTALNLLPIGQLDGGHIIYGMFGSKVHFALSKLVLFGMLGYGGLGILSPYDEFGAFLQSFFLLGLFYFWCLNPYFKLMTTSVIGALSLIAAQLIVVYYFPTVKGYNFWLVFAFISARILGIKHPPSLEEKKLDPVRFWLGAFSMFVFVISFTPNVLSFEVIQP